MAFVLTPGRGQEKYSFHKRNWLLHIGFKTNSRTKGTVSADLFSLMEVVVRLDQDK